MWYNKFGINVIGRLEMWVLDMSLHLLIFRVSAYWVKGRVLIKHGKGYEWLLYRKFGITEIRWYLEVGLWMPTKYLVLLKLRVGFGLSTR